MSKTIDGPRIATFTMVGQGKLMYGRQVFEPRMEDETHEQHDRRTAPQKVTTDPVSGNVVINGDAVKRSLEWAASWRNEKLPGGAGGKATFKKRFMAGVTPADPYFPVSNGKAVVEIKDLTMELLSVPSGGQRGGAKRVLRTFPTLLPPWTVACRLMILDMAIDDKVFESHIKTAGMYDGMGSMRIGNGGPNGRFEVRDLSFEALKI